MRATPRVDAVMSGEHKEIRIVGLAYDLERELLVEQDRVAFFRPEVARLKALLVKAGVNPDENPPD
jgi:hypothetical protein